ncbi:MAG: hypothetical protein AABZ06_06695 [Bdellovibrionota bacterium]
MLYNNRPQFGYPPGAFTITAQNFSPWQVYDSSIREMVMAIHTHRMTESTPLLTRYGKQAFKKNNDYFESYCSKKPLTDPQFPSVQNSTPELDWASLLGICVNRTCGE